MITSKFRLWAVVFFIGSGLMSGCSSFVSGATKSLANQLQTTISEHNDPELVKDAIPAYMLLVESLLLSDPENVDLLVASSNLYSAYSSVFVNDKARQQKLATRAFTYGKSAICFYEEDFCGIEKWHVAKLSERLADTDEDDVAVLFALGASWAGWIQSHSHNLLDLLATVATSQW